MNLIKLPHCQSCSLISMTTVIKQEIKLIHTYAAVTFLVSIMDK